MCVRANGHLSCVKYSSIVFALGQRANIYITCTMHVLMLVELSLLNHDFSCAKTCALFPQVQNPLSWLRYLLRTSGTFSWTCHISVWLNSKHETVVHSNYKFIILVIDML